ncbi:hypothetical protein BDN72DRAFT_590626 [Pluteus cervinus]|uniref:Uncharacterized protein n=1 Tax=Pluteus cervinus TaxID=181527 RepID=A0ACD3A448_9AGAR|nr:hypothetical protein BDN72DRAFT_590626 [Pluteus cervinus]
MGRRAPRPCSEPTVPIPSVNCNWGNVSAHVIWFFTLKDCSDVTHKFSAETMVSPQPLPAYPFELIMSSIRIEPILYYEISLGRQFDQGAADSKLLASVKALSIGPRTLSSFLNSLLAACTSVKSLTLHSILPIAFWHLGRKTSICRTVFTSYHHGQQDSI